jgi:serine kinase of HPr protein (carbohydrate metabolism regulator)
MTNEATASETIHASCVAIAGRAVLIEGRSGSGKSDLALRLIDRGAALVSDDYTLVRNVDGRLIASAPATITGMMEVRGVGLVDMPALAEASVGLLVSLNLPVARLPEDEPATRTIAGGAVPVVPLAAFEASAPIKAELALRQFGLPER